MAAARPWQRHWAPGPESVRGVLMSRRGAGARRIEILRWRCRDWLRCFAGAGRGWLSASAPPYCGWAGEAAPGPPVVLKAELDGDINTITASYIEQAVKRAESAGAEAVVLVMNTPGGDSQSMDAIVTTLLNSRVPVIAFVSPAGAGADSAGLFVAQAADLVAMAPGSNTGSATH